MILRLTLTTAQLVGETAAEWQTLEKCVRLGEWTSGPRRDEGVGCDSSRPDSGCGLGSRASRRSGPNLDADASGR
jgi:hypothetical protein